MAEQVWHCVLSAKLPRGFSSRLGVTLPGQCPHKSSAVIPTSITKTRKSMSHEMRPETRRKETTHKQQANFIGNQFVPSSVQVGLKSGKHSASKLAHGGVVHCPHRLPHRVFVLFVRRQSLACWRFQRAACRTAVRSFFGLCVGMFEGRQLAMEPILPIGPICPACGFAPSLARLRRRRSCLHLSFGSVSDTSLYALQLS